MRPELTPLPSAVFALRCDNSRVPPAGGMLVALGAHRRRAASAEGLVARAARRGQLVRFSVPDDYVSRAVAEARSGSGRGGEAAAPTMGVPETNQAPRSRSEAKAERSCRRWAYDGVSPTGARRDRSGDRTDRAEGGKRRHRSGAGAITYKVGGASSGREQSAGAPQARSVGGRWLRRELALGGDFDRERVAAVVDRGRRAEIEDTGLASF